MVRQASQPKHVIRYLVSHRVLRMPEVFVGALGSLDFRLIAGQNCFCRLFHMRVRQ